MIPRPAPPHVAKLTFSSSGSAADTQAVADIIHYHLQMYKYVTRALHPHNS
jgi:20S proteasome alpha/beta subunit